VSWLGTSSYEEGRCTLELPMVTATAGSRLA
jgi:hypothetical protein